MQDERFNSMEARVVNRAHVTPALNEITSQHPTKFWLENLEKETVGCAPILHLDEVFADPQVQARDMEIRMKFPGFEKPCSLIGSPFKFSRSKVDYRLPPPRVGEHTEQVLKNAGYKNKEIAELGEIGAIDIPTFDVPGIVRPLAPKAVRTPKYNLTGNAWKKMRSVSIPTLDLESLETDPSLADESAPSPPK